MPPSLPAMLPTCLALTCLAQSSANSSHGPMAGRDGDVSSVLRPVPGCDVRCRRSPVARPVLAGSQAEQGRCSRCARLCLQLRFAFRETLHPCQPLACQPAVSPPGPAPRGCRALGPKAPSFWGANAAERGCALSRGGGLSLFWTLGRAVGHRSRAWGGHSCCSGCHAVPAPCITPPPGVRSLWSPDVALRDVGVPTFGHRRHSSPSCNTSPTCTPLAPRGPSPHNLQVPSKPRDTPHLCPGVLEVPAQLKKGPEEGGRIRAAFRVGKLFPGCVVCSPPACPGFVCSAECVWGGEG